MVGNNSAAVASNTSNYKRKIKTRLRVKKRRIVWSVRIKSFIFAPHFERSAKQFGLWCNGSTTGFGSVCPSSNLGSPTQSSSYWRISGEGFFKFDWVSPYLLKSYHTTLFILSAQPFISLLYLCPLNSYSLQPKINIIYSHNGI